MSKQFLRRSCHRLIAFITLIFIVSLSAMDNDTQENRPTTYRKLKKTEKHNSSKHSQEKKQLFHGYSQQQLESIYNRAPQAVKRLLVRLENPDLEPAEADIQAAFFLGKPGTGKTSTVTMMAWKLHRALVSIRATKFTGEHRGTSTVNLRRQLDTMVNPMANGITTIPTIGFIDEISAILRRGDDNHFDNATTAEEFGGFLEDQKNNKNFFCVVAMNDCSTFTDLMKSRMKGKIVVFKDIIDPQHKVDVFKEKLCTPKITLHPECDSTFLINTVGSVQGWSGRDFRSLANKVIDKYMKDSNTSGRIKIKKYHIEQALKKMQKDDVLLQWGATIKTDYEQREDHHRESIDLQKEQHQDNIETQLFMQTHQKPIQSITTSIGIGGTGISTTTNTSSGIDEKKAQEFLEQKQEKKENSPQNQADVADHANDHRLSNGIVVITLMLFAAREAASSPNCTIQ